MNEGAHDTLGGELIADLGPITVWWVSRHNWVTVKWGNGSYLEDWIAFSGSPSDAWDRQVLKKTCPSYYDAAMAIVAMELAHRKV